MIFRRRRPKTVRYVIRARALRQLGLAPEGPPPPEKKKPSRPTHLRLVDKSDGGEGVR
jgi:hypothetical protein